MVGEGSGDHVAVRLDAALASAAADDRAGHNRHRHQRCDPQPMQQLWGPVRRSAAGQHGAVDHWQILGPQHPLDNTFDEGCLSRTFRSAGLAAPKVSPPSRSGATGPVTCFRRPLSGSASNVPWFSSANTWSKGFAMRDLPAWQASWQDAATRMVGTGPRLHRPPAACLVGAGLGAACSDVLHPLVQLLLLKLLSLLHEGLQIRFQLGGQAGPGASAGGSLAGGGCTCHQVECSSMPGDCLTPAMTSDGIFAAHRAWDRALGGAEGRLGRRAGGCYSKHTHLSTLGVSALAKVGWV